MTCRWEVKLPEVEHRTRILGRLSECFTDHSGPGIGSNTRWRRLDQANGSWDCAWATRISTDSSTRVDAGMRLLVAAVSDDRKIPIRPSPAIVQEGSDGNRSAASDAQSNSGGSPGQRQF